RLASHADLPVLLGILFLQSLPRQPPHVLREVVAGRADGSEVPDTSRPTRAPVPALGARQGGVGQSIGHEEKPTTYYGMATYVHPPFVTDCALGRLRAVSSASSCVSGRLVR